MNKNYQKDIKKNIEANDMDTQTEIKGSFSEKIDAKSSLDKILQRFVHCPSSDAVYDVISKQKYSVQQFKRNYNAGVDFIKSDKRIIVDGEKFCPQKPEPLISEYNHNEKQNNIYLNMYKGYPYPPKKNETAVKLFMELFDLITCNLTEEEKEYMLDWIAAPLQSPGFKTGVAVIVYSRIQGIGKSLLGTIIRNLYDEFHVNIVRNKLLCDKFNAFSQNKLLITADELALFNTKSTEAMQIISDLKEMISETRRVIMKKHMEPELTYDYANYFFTTNNKNMLNLEKGDRRFFIVNADIKEDPSPDFLAKIYEQIDNPEFISALLYYFTIERKKEENRAIKNQGRALTTSFKSEIAAITNNPIEEWFYGMQSHVGEHYELSGLYDIKICNKNCIHKNNPYYYKHCYNCEEVSYKIVPVMMSFNDVQRCLSTMLNKDKDFTKTNLIKKFRVLNLNTYMRKIYFGKSGRVETYLVFAPEQEKEFLTELLQKENYKQIIVYPDFIDNKSNLKPKPILIIPEKDE